MKKVFETLFFLLLLCVFSETESSAAVRITDTEIVGNEVIISGKLTDNEYNNVVFCADGENGTGFTDKGADAEISEDDYYGNCVKMYAGADEDAIIKYSLPEPFMGKKFCISYDIKPMQKTQPLFMGGNSYGGRETYTEYTFFGAYINTKGISYAPRAIWHNGTSGGAEYEVGKWYHFDAVYNLESRQVTYYLDGAEQGTTSIYENTLENGLCSIYFSTAYTDIKSEDSVFYIDNVCVRDNSSEELYAECYNNDELLDVVFSEALTDAENVFFELRDEKNNIMPISHTEVINPSWIRVYHNNRLDADNKYFFSVNNAEGICGTTLKNPLLILNGKEVTLNILTAGKNGEDLMNSTNPMEIIKFCGQKKSNMDGSFTFTAELDEGIYNAYISDGENHGEAVKIDVCFKENTYVFKSDFENYISGKPEDWTDVSGGVRYYKKATEQNNSYLSIDTTTGEKGLFKSLQGLSLNEPIKISFDIAVSDSTNDRVSVKLLEKYSAKADEEYVFDLFNINPLLNPGNIPHITPPGYMGYFAGQKANAVLSEHDLECAGNRWYNVDIWLDFNTGQAAYYINDAYLGKAEINPEINSLEGIAVIAWRGNSGGNVYLDDFEIRKIPYAYLRMLRLTDNSIPDFLTGMCVTAIRSEKNGNIFFDKNVKLNLEIFSDKHTDDVTVYYVIDSDVSSAKAITTALAKGKNVIELNCNNVPYGKHQIEAVVKKGTEKAVCNTSFSVVNAPKDGIKNYSFGITTHVNPEYGDSAIQAELTEKSGMGFVRTSLPWESYQKGINEYEIPSGMKSHYNITYNAGMGQLITLGTQCPQIGVDGIPDSEEDYKALEEYAYNAALEFKGQGVFFEPYNEYSFTKGEYGEADEQKEIEAYINIIKSVYNGVKRADSDAKVMGFAAAHTKLSWIPKVLEAGGGQYMDGISIHVYPQGAPDIADGENADDMDILINEQVRAIRESMSGNGMSDKPLWMSEYGWSVVNVSEEKQAEYIVKGVVLNESERICDKIFVYNTMEKPEYKNSIARSTEIGFGLLKANNTDIPYEAKCSYIAVSNYNAIVGGSEFKEKIQYEDYSCYRFADVGKTVDCVWSTTETELILNGLAGVSVVDLYGNEIIPRNISGDKYAVTVTQMPIYIINEAYKVAVTNSGNKHDSLSGVCPGDEMEICVQKGKEVQEDENVFVIICEYKAGIPQKINKFDIDFREKTEALIPYVKQDGDMVKVFVWNKDLTPLVREYSLYK